MKRRNRLIRIFVSSTFQDMERERNAIQRIVVPRMKRKCADKGYQFEMVDLRWGISEEASQAHRTMSICLEELERSRLLSPKPCLLILLGQRYGWQPLPEFIKKDDAERIMMTASLSEKIEFERVYQLDQCAIPERYTLMKDGDEMLLKGMIERCDDASIRTHYLSSATEQEIQQGLIKHKELFNHVVSYSRIIQMIPKEKESLFIEKDKLSEIENLHRIVKNATSERCQIGRKLYFSEYESNAYDEWFAEEVSRRLEIIVEEEVNDCSIDDYVEDQLTQKYIVDNAPEVYQYRGNEVEEVLKLLQHKANGRVCIIRGQSGSGLTSFAAYICNKLIYCGSRVIYRFAGVGKMSSSTLLMLRSIMHELDVPYSAGDSEFDLLTRLRIYLDDCSEKPIIIIDGLYNLSPQSWLLQNSWIPSPIPEGLFILFTIPETYEINDGLAKEATEIKLPTLDNAKFIASFIDELKIRHRRLTAVQLGELQNVYNSIQSPLSFKTLESIAIKWTSSEIPKIECDNIYQLVSFLLNQIIKTGFHDRQFVGLALGLICYCRNGVSESEILQITAADGNFFSRLASSVHYSFSQYERPMIPFIYWARLHNDIDFLLTLRQSFGGITYVFSNNTIKQCVEKWLVDNYDIKRHVQKLAINYFFDIKNNRSYEELPFLLNEIGDLNCLQSLLSSDDFMLSKCAADMTWDLMDDYHKFLSNNHCNIGKTKDIETKNKFISKEYTTIIEYSQFSSDFIKVLWDDFINTQGSTYINLKESLTCEANIIGNIVSAAACEKYMAVCTTIQRTSDEYMLCRIVDLESNQTVDYTCLPLGFGSWKPEKMLISKDGKIVLLFSTREERYWLWDTTIGSVSVKKVDGLCDMLITDTNEIFFSTDNSISGLDGSICYLNRQQNKKKSDDIVSFSDLIDTFFSSSTNLYLSSTGDTVFAVSEGCSNYVSINIIDKIFRFFPSPDNCFENIKGYSRSTNQLIYKKGDGIIYCYNLVSGTEKAIDIELQRNIGAAIIVDSRYVVCNTHNNITYYDLQTRETHVCDEHYDGSKLVEIEKTERFLSYGTSEIRIWRFMDKK